MSVTLVCVCNSGLFCARLGLHRCKVQKKIYARVQSSKKIYARIFNIMWCDIKLPLLWSVVTKVYYLNGMFKKCNLLHVQQMCWAHSFFAQRRFLMTNDPETFVQFSGLSQLT